MSEQQLALREEVAVAVQPQDTVLSIIAAAARDPQVDVAKMSALLDFKERLDASEAKRQYDAAFAAMSQDMPRVKKDGTIDLGSKGRIIPFATWDEMDAVLRPILKKHGFSLSFPTRVDGQLLIMACVLTHVGGHSERSEMVSRPDPGPGRNDTQAVGSGRSYAKRYLTKDMLNIVEEGKDDNGKGAGFIDKKQSEKIYTLLDACELDATRRANYLKLLNADMVEHIQNFNFDRAVNELRAELKRQGKQLA